MAKFHGIIGFGVTEKTSPGVWKDTVTERRYTGDVIKNAQRWNSKDEMNPELTISDTISIIGDSFAMENVSAIKFVEWRGAKWCVKTITVEPPRVLLAIGGLYHGDEE